MGKGGKRTKLVKPERQLSSRSANEESVSIVRQPPSPIPEESENAFVAQRGVHDEPGPIDSWVSGANTASAPGTWYASPRPSPSSSPRPRGYGQTSWGQKSDRSSMSRDIPPRRPSSSYSNTVSARRDQDDNRSIGEDELEYVSDEPSGMDPDSNMQQQQWNADTQDGSKARPYPPPGPPQSQQEQPQKPPLSGPSYNIYAMSFSNPPVAPNPLPPPPNVLSKASDAATRLDRSKNGDPPPQPPLVLPLPPAAWHDWIKPGTYAPKPGPSAPPPAPPHPPPLQGFPHPAPAAPAVGFLPKGPIRNSTRGIWDLKHGKGFPANAPMHQSRGRAPSGQWSRPRSRTSVDGWTPQTGGGAFGDAWNKSGWGAAAAGESGGWGATGMAGENSGWRASAAGERSGFGAPAAGERSGWGASAAGERSGWGAAAIGESSGWGAAAAGESSGLYGNERGNRRHGRSKSEGVRGRKRNVQWEEGSSSEESEEEEADDGWGERDASGWGQGNSSQVQWSKPDNTWGGRDQSAWNQGGGLGHQSAGGYNWGEGLKSQYATDATAGATPRGIVSPQQKAQILNSFLNVSNQMQPGQAGQGEHRTSRLASKRAKREDRGQTQYNAGWGLGDESWGGNTHDDDDDDDDDEEEEEKRKLRASNSKRASKSWEAWGTQEASRYSMPSMTLAHVYKDTKTRLDFGSQSQLDDLIRTRFHESRGAALVQVQNAFFGNTRLARDRIHWSFPPDKDERVRAALTWVQEMSYGLAALGLHKYLQHRERGALVINADFRTLDRPTDFSVDYLTFDDLQKSRDKTLQVSVISYDPAMTVIVFVFLPSKTGNSIAIWRRKLFVPNNVRLRFQKELAIALSGLKNPQAYGVHVEEDPRTRKDLPNPPKLGDQAKPKKKRKWWQLFKLFKS